MVSVPNFDHDFDFDPTYGYSQQQLEALIPPAGPNDFDAFWTETRQVAMDLPLDIRREELTSSVDHRIVEKVSFTTMDGIQVAGWLTRPKNQPATHAWLVGHGYGGREAPDLAPNDNAVRYFLCAPGFHLSAAPDLPDNSGAHVIHGIASKETYLIRHCVASMWQAITVIQKLCPELSWIGYDGTSFGGGLGALMLPWEDRLQAAYIGQPTFGNHPIRLQCKCVGSGESVRQYAKTHPEVIDVLVYYDAATAASRIQIPVLTQACLFDPAVCPPGQFSVANAITSAGSKTHVALAGHFAGFPGEFEENRRLVQSRQAFFADYLPSK